MRSRAGRLSVTGETRRGGDQRRYCAGVSTPSLSVVIVCHDSAEELGRTLPALTSELEEGDELIVADNGSADASLEVVRSLAPQARLLELGAERRLCGRLRRRGRTCLRRAADSAEP